MTRMEAEKVLVEAHYCLVHLERKMQWGRETYVCDKCMAEREAEQQQRLSEALAVLRMREES